MCEIKLHSQIVHRTLFKTSICKYIRDLEYTNALTITERVASFPDMFSINFG